MSCFSCFGGGDRKEKKDKKEGSEEGSVSSKGTPPAKQENHKHNNSVESVSKEALNQSIDAQTFTFRELASATKNFTPDHLLGEGGFGRVYKGCLEASGQAVAVKRLDRNSIEGNKEFLAQVSMISHLNHPNMVKLIGYCADGDQRLLVYELMPRGSVKDHLIDLKPEQKPIDWYSRMKLAYGTAQGLEYLHDKANPPVIYRDLKSSNILLTEEFTPKLSDLGLADLSMGDNKTHVASRMMGTYGYSAPEYDRAGHLTPKSDVYSFGVVLLELITGRTAIDTMKPTAEQNLVSWAQPMFKDQKKFPELVDPLLGSNYPAKSLNQAVGVAAMCLQEEASVRPLMADVVMALSFLIDPPPTPQSSPTAEAAPVVEPSKSSGSGDSSDGGVVETIQLSKKKRTSSKHERADSSSRRSSAHGSDHETPKQGNSNSRSSKHRRAKYGSSKQSKKSSHGSDDSDGSSWEGSEYSGSDNPGEEEMHHGSGSRNGSFGSPHGSQHGIMHSNSSRVSRESLRHSDESE